MIYFDNAATQGKRPPCVFEALEEGLLMSVNPRRTAGEAGKTALFLINEIRQMLTAYCGISGNTILLSGCTEALNLAILGHCGEGAIVTTQAEHNSVLRPVYALGKRGREIRILEVEEDGRLNPLLFEQSLEGASLAIVTHISNVTGAQNDIETLYSIAKSKGVTFIADVAQSAGHIPIKGDADLFALPAHKGLYGPPGCGALVMREGIQLNPLIYGGTGSDSQNEDMPEFAPERYEAGTRNICGILAWGAALKWLTDKEDALAKRRRAVQSKLVSLLREIDEIRLLSVPNDCGIVTFTLKSDFDSALWCEELSSSYKVACRGGLHCAPLLHKRLGTFESGAVRLSVDASNTVDEGEYVANCIKAMCRKSH